MARDDPRAARPIRVLLLLSSLHGGGAERVAARLATMSDGRTLDIRIGLLRRAGPFLDAVDPARVMAPADGDRWFAFDGAANARFYRPDKLLAGAFLAPFAFRRMVRDFRPDIVMSFLKGTTLIADLALVGLGRDRPRFIVREGNNTLKVIAEELSQRWARRLIGWYVAKRYRAADAVLVNSQAMADGLAADLGIARDRFRVINNPIDTAGVRAKAAEAVALPTERPFLVTVGRLEYQKAHDVLLTAYAASVARSSHDLVIVGRGSLTAATRALAGRLGIGGRVHIVDFTANPWAIVARAAAFVLPSRWEGFPTALAEAQACGVPVIAADCRFGPSEIVDDGETGLLIPVDDTAALTAAIDRVTGDPALAARLGAAGAASVEAFARDAMLDRYAQLFAAEAAMAPA